MILMIRKIVAATVLLVGSLICFLGFTSDILSYGSKALLFVIIGLPALILFRLIWPFPKRARRAKPAVKTHETGEAKSAARSDVGANATSTAAPRGAFREYRIEYADADGEVTEREIYVFALDQENPDFVKAWCYNRRDMRTFRSSRVLNATHLPSGAAVRNLAKHYRQTANS